MGEAGAKAKYVRRPRSIKDFVHQARAEGMTITEIALAYDQSITTVADLLKDFDLTKCLVHPYCEECGQPPTKKDQGQLTFFRGAWLCYDCIREGGTDEDWYPFIELLIYGPQPEGITLGERVEMEAPQLDHTGLKIFAD